MTSCPLQWIAIVEATVGLAEADRVEIVFYLRMISATANASSSGLTSRGRKVLLSNLIMTHVLGFARWWLRGKMTRKHRRRLRTRTHLSVMWDEKKRCGARNVSLPWDDMVKATSWTAACCVPATTKALMVVTGQGCIVVFWMRKI